MTCHTKEQLEEMLFDVVNALDLSDLMAEEHGPQGTPPATLVRLVLEQKDLQINLLKRGFVAIAPNQTEEITQLRTENADHIQQLRKEQLYVQELCAQVMQLTTDLKYSRMAAAAEARRVDELCGENRQQAEALRLARNALESCVDGDYSTGHVIHSSFDEDAVNNALSAVDSLDLSDNSDEIIANNRLSILAEVSKMMNDTPMPLWGVGMEKLKGRK